MYLTITIAITFFGAADALTMLGDDLLDDRESFLIFPASVLGPGKRLHVIDTTGARDPNLSSWRRH